MEGEKGGGDGGGTLVSMYNEKKELLNRKLKNKIKTNKQKNSLAKRVRKRKIIPGDLREIILKDFEKNRGDISTHEIVNGSFGKKIQRN